MTTKRTKSTLNMSALRTVELAAWRMTIASGQTLAFVPRNRRAGDLFVLAPGGEPARIGTVDVMPTARTKIDVGGYKSVACVHVRALVWLDDDHDVSCHATTHPRYAANVAKTLAAGVVFLAGAEAGGWAQDHAGEPPP